MAQQLSENKIQRLEEAKLAEAAKKPIREILNGKTRYAELWYGTPASMNNALAQLKEILPENEFSIKNKKSKDADGREYYVITIAKRIGGKTVPVVEKPKVAGKKAIPTPALQVDKTSIDYNALSEKFGDALSTQIMHWSNMYKVDPLFIASLIVAEHSGRADTNALDIVGKRLKKNPNFYNNAISGKGDINKESRGLMQITKPTYETITKLLGLGKNAKPYEETVADYALSIRYAARYVAYLQKQLNTQDIDELAAAYNSGPAKVISTKEKNKGIGKLSLEYRQKVKRAYGQLEAEKKRLGGAPPE
ncbi:MAG: transglycosylase SLT domain-containing protein [Candidatus Micrarchaeota archaeon]|nr:transglycosylase SLT domain-containing protein [Candidatus Micrarchaeota archaeon]